MLGLGHAAAAALPQSVWCCLLLECVVLPTPAAHPSRSTQAGRFPARRGQAARRLPAAARSGAAGAPSRRSWATPEARPPAATARNPTPKNPGPERRLVGGGGAGAGGRLQRPAHQLGGRPQPQRLKGQLHLPPSPWRSFRQVVRSTSPQVEVVKSASAGCLVGGVGQRQRRAEVRAETQGAAAGDLCGDGGGGGGGAVAWWRHCC